MSSLVWIWKSTEVEKYNKNMFVAEMLHSLWFKQCSSIVKRECLTLQLFILRRMSSFEVVCEGCKSAKRCPSSHRIWLTVTFTVTEGFIPNVLSVLKNIEKEDKSFACKADHIFSLSICLNFSLLEAGKLHWGRYRGILAQFLFCIGGICYVLLWEPGCGIDDSSFVRSRAAVLIKYGCSNKMLQT